MSEIIWNPWHGCKKYSPGCQHCYVYRRDERIGRDASQVVRTASFDLPARLDRTGQYKLPGGTHVFACMTSDFFLEEADTWRERVWAIMRSRPDLHFSIITKRIVRAAQCLPKDWGLGWEHVSLGCTVEDQTRADERLPLFLDLPCRHRFVICEPLLERVDLQRYLQGSAIERVVAGGESGPQARLCRYEWILFLRDQCVRMGTAFRFRQTGARFEKDGRVYRFPRTEQMDQAQCAGLDSEGKGV